MTTEGMNLYIHMFMKIVFYLSLKLLLAILRMETQPSRPWTDSFENVHFIQNYEKYQGLYFFLV